MPNSSNVQLADANSAIYKSVSEPDAKMAKLEACITDVVDIITNCFGIKLKSKSPCEYYFTCACNGEKATIWTQSPKQLFVRWNCIKCLRHKTIFEDNLLGLGQMALGISYEKLIKKIIRFEKAKLARVSVKPAGPPKRNDWIFEISK